MTLGQHLDELRARLIFALLGLLPIVGAAFYFGEELLDLVLAPARRALQQGEQPDITALGPLETFSGWMRISMIAAVVVGSPWIFYQLWRFVSPGLHKHEKRFAYFLVPLSGILTATGVFFLFKVVLPLILTFLITFGTTIGTKPVPTAPLAEGVSLPTIPLLTTDPDAPTPGQMWVNTSIHRLRICVTPADTAKGAPPGVLSIDMYREANIRQQYRVSDILSLMLTLILAFAGAFQTPLIVLLLGWAGIVDRAFLAKYRRHAILICAVIAAAIMPGDPASMTAMMIPLYFLYELGGLLLWLFPAHRVAGKPRPALETTEDDDDRP
jgi:sec-independent protein translocase protein TatC